MLNIPISRARLQELMTVVCGTKGDVEASLRVCIHPSACAMLRHGPQGAPPSLALRS